MNNGEYSENVKNQERTDRLSPEEIVEMLIKDGQMTSEELGKPDIDEFSTFSNTFSEEKVFEFLNNFLEELQETSICHLIDAGFSPKLIEFMIIIGVDIHEREDAALEFASKRDDGIIILKLLKDSGMQFDTKTGAIAAMNAIARQKLEVIEFLLQNELDVHYNNDEIISYAIKCANHEFEMCNTKRVSKYLDILKLLLNSATY